MAVSASKIKEIQTKLDKGATLQSLYNKGYAKSAIVAACKGKAASIIKKELATPKKDEKEDDEVENK